MLRSGSKRRRETTIPDEVLLAFRLQTEGRAAQAERLYLGVLDIDPCEPNALHQLGLLYRDRGEHETALTYMEAAVRADRRSTEALSNCGLILQDLKRHKEAIETFNRAVVIDRNNAAAIYNRGNSLLALERFDEALASYQRVLALDPGHVDALYNRGNALRELRRHDEALASYRRALAIRPDYADVHVNEALMRLRLGDFRDGFAKYEWRWKKKEVAALQRHFPQPLWLGDAPLAGRALLLHAEQGFGDTIQFARYVQLVAWQGADVILEVQPTLKALMRQLAGVSVVTGRGEGLPRFDFHCPLLSLPFAFETELATIPGIVPYLVPPPDRVAKWQDRLQRRKPLRVGIAWAGSASYQSDENRSIALGQLAPLWSHQDIEFVSIQREPRPADKAVLEGNPHLLHVGPDLEDFADTAAVVSLLDIVVSIDTSIAHLAGALGKPVLIMLPYSPDFRWMLDRDDSPWYPTARLFRQPRRGDWDSVIERVRQEIVLPSQLPQG
jgi:tetratricopeptide (TPR) repeat protein